MEKFKTQTTRGRVEGNSLAELEGASSSLRERARIVPVGKSRSFRNEKRETGADPRAFFHTSCLRMVSVASAHSAWFQSSTDLVGLAAAALARVPKQKRGSCSVMVTDHVNLDRHHCRTAAASTYV